MKKYEKPRINDEDIEIEDIINNSNLTDEEWGNIIV